MINSINTVEIDGIVIDHDEVLYTLKLDEGDRFTRWVLRPLCLLAAIGVGVVMVFASVFMMLLSLALVPILAISVWAVRAKLQRDIKNREPIVETPESGN